jgi:hypothetical protein
MPNHHHHQPVPKAAEPHLGRSFDPWNSVALGHQRAETKGPSGWQENRNRKLHNQFRSDGTGGARIRDAVGPGSRLAEQLAATARAPDGEQESSKSRPTVLDMLRNPGTAKPVVPRRNAEARAEGKHGEPRGIFSGLVIYVNGSTHPAISDHRLKQVLAEHGGRTSVHLARRQVTHVVLGRPASAGGGAGGGLAGGKIDREVRRIGGKGVKVVGVEW